MALTYEQIQAAAKKKGISQQNVDKFAAMKWVSTQTPPKPTYKTVDESLIVSNAGQQWLQPWYAKRKLPTVATPEDPVKNFNVGALVYDETNPEDYLLKLKAKTATGKSPTEQEIYQWYVAEKALSNMQKDKISTDPFADRQSELQKRLEQAQSTELNSDAKALEEYKKSLEAQYESSKQELLASWARQKDAAQQVFSFSGFGRSSDAAQTAVDIQQKTDSAINNLNLAMQAEIALKEAELAGSDSDTLSAINEEIASYRKAAQDWQIDAIKSTQEANAKWWASYMDAIMNLAAAATKSGIELGDAKNIQEMASLAKNADGTINEEFVKTLPEDIQAIIRSAAMTSTGNKEPAKTQSVGSGKSERVYQWNPVTERYDIPVWGAWFGGGWGWGWGGGSWSWVPLGDLGADLLSNLYTAASKIANSTVRSSGLLDPDAQLALNFVKSNLTLDRIKQLKQEWVSLGALSEGEWVALANTVGNVGAGNSKAAALEQINRMIRNAWGLPISLDDAKKKTNPIAPTTPWATNTTPPSTPAQLPSGWRL